jgi:Thioesterase-like superfamily
MLSSVGSFADDVTVSPVGRGRYICELSGDWDLVAVPQGGVIAAVALRAAALEVESPEQMLHTCTTVFAGQVAAGPLVVDVKLLRRGRSATQVLASVANDGVGSGATVLAVYGGPRGGPTFVDVAALR